MKKEPVIFRKWRKSDGGGIIALFPQIPVSINCRFAQSYEHIGQHGAADPLIVGNKTTPAKLADYKELKKELESEGYALIIKKRITRADRKTREKRIEGTKNEAI
jgi:hypothetical protein